MKMSAVISECGTYRYELTREWGESDPACFIGLNPSTADAYKDDPTIRRCISFAEEWDCGGLIMVNIYGYRATKPKDMFSAAGRGVNIVGPENMMYVKKAIQLSAVSIAAWGNDGDCCDANDLIATGRLKHLGLNKNGTPKHPLYLPKNSKPMEFEF